MPDNTLLSSQNPIVIDTLKALGLQNIGTPENISAGTQESLASVKPLLSQGTQELLNLNETLQAKIPQPPPPRIPQLKEGDKRALQLSTVAGLLALPFDRKVGSQILEGASQFGQVAFARSQQEAKQQRANDVALFNAQLNVFADMSKSAIANERDTIGLALKNHLTLKALVSQGRIQQRLGVENKVLDTLISANMGDPKTITDLAIGFHEIPTFRNGKIVFTPVDRLSKSELTNIAIGIYDRSKDDKGIFNMQKAIKIIHSNFSPEQAIILQRMVRDIAGNNKAVYKESINDFLSKASNDNKLAVATATLFSKERNPANKAELKREMDKHFASYTNNLANAKALQMLSSLPDSIVSSSNIGNIFMQFRESLRQELKVDFDRIVRGIEDRELGIIQARLRIKGLEIGNLINKERLKSLKLSEQYQSLQIQAESLKLQDIFDKIKGADEEKIVEAVTKSTESLMGLVSEALKLDLQKIAAIQDTKQREITQTTLVERNSNILSLSTAMKEILKQVKKDDRKNAAYDFVLIHERLKNSLIANLPSSDINLEIEYKLAKEAIQFAKKYGIKPSELNNSLVNDIIIEEELSRVRQNAIPFAPQTPITTAQTNALNKNPKAKAQFNRIGVTPPSIPIPFP